MLITPLAAFIAALAVLAVAESEIAVCNGHKELCDRKYSNVTFIGSHDSAFVGSHVADNQMISLTEQLGMGVRFLQTQTHDDEGIIEMCHTACFLRDAGPLHNLLKLVKQFLDSNPTEIVTLLITNQDGFNASKFDTDFKHTGLDKYAFAPKEKLETDQWPTLGEMIAEGKRLVVFIDYAPHNTVPYIIEEFDKTIIETPFEYPSLDDLAHCPVDRPAGAGPDDGMLLTNHWLQKNDSGILIPSRDMANVTNSENYINRHVESCQRTLGKTPTFILLDWINVGDAMLVQDAMNRLPAGRKTREMSAAPTLEAAEGVDR